MNVDDLLGEFSAPVKKQKPKPQADDLLNDLISGQKQQAKPVQRQVQHSKHRSDVPSQNLQKMFEDEPAPKQTIVKVSEQKPAATQNHSQPATKPSQKPPQAQVEDDNIWGGPRREKTVKQVTALVPLKEQILSQCTMDDFFTLLFADKRVKAISDNWYQGLRCRELDAPVVLAKPATWAIHQAAGGPCGFIAVLQARATKFLFLNQKPPISIDNKPFRSAVLSALYETFRRVSDVFQVVLPLDYARAGGPAADRVTQEMEKFGVQNLGSDQLLQLFQSPEFQTYCFQETSSFVPAMVLSLVLSRGVLKVKGEDFDRDSQIATGSLFANFNNCSQELVNLLLTGRATPNVHDGQLDVGGMILNGVQAQADVGLLTIYEHHEYLNVGTYLKQPQFNVWVLFNEAHFTTLFVMDQIVVQEGEQDFIYMDQLDDQSKLCRITVKTDETKFKKVKEPESYVEAIIQTLVPSVGFDWHGHDKYIC